MAHDVFISYSTKDKLIADAAVAHLERNGIRCWYAPRDILPGRTWPGEIVHAVESSRVLVVIFSKHANESVQIPREVGRACSHGIPVVPVRIEHIQPSGDLEYFLSTSHWMDALTPPIETYLDELTTKLKALMQLDSKGPAKAVNPPSEPRAQTGRKWGAPQIAVICGGLLVVVSAGLLMTHLKREHDQGQVQTQPAPVPAPGPGLATAAAPSAPIVHGPPIDPPTEPPNPADTAIEQAADWQPPKTAALMDDYRTWRRLSRIHWENSFFLDNAKQRYAQWFKAADENDPVGQFFVGCAYRQGIGVAEDESSATRWLAKAVAGTNSDALTTMVALNIGSGRGVPGWAYKAGETKNVGGMAVLGFGLIADAHPKTKESGARWLKMAAAGGSLDARSFLILTSGEAPAKILAETQKLADAGNPSALFYVAVSRGDDPTASELVKRGLKMMGQASEVSALIDPVPGQVSQANIVIKYAWQRLHEMSAAGYGAAARAIEELHRKGLKEL